MRKSYIILACSHTCQLANLIVLWHQLLCQVKVLFSLCIQKLNITYFQWLIINDLRSGPV